VNDGLRKFMDSKQDGFFYIGHASALVRIDQKLILFDPVWNHTPYGKWWTFVPEQIDCDEILERISVCVISHIHEDHVCEEILKKLKCPILIMGGRSQLRQRLEGCSYQVIQMPRMKWMKHAGLEFYFVPHSFNTVDSSCFVRSKDYCVYHGNDNFLGPELLLKCGEDVPRVDLAMVPYAFIHYYPFLLDSLSEDEKQREIGRLNIQSIEQAQQFRRVMKPVVAIPFGASLFYDDGAMHPLNRNLATPFQHGFIAMFAGNYLMKDYDSNLEDVDYSKMLVDKLGGQKLKPVDPEVVFGGREVEMVHKRVFRQNPPKLNHIISVNGLQIDLMGTDRKPEERISQTGFNFDAGIFYKWVRGELTFERAIGTRRFTYTRSPNVYNLEVIEWYNKYL
jgi:L-ascorbate metabolism protein UlaG (beta-lactamase superfamily)